MVRLEIPSYDDVQDRLADATAGMQAESILDLGSGTGFTAQRVIRRHPGCAIVGIDVSSDMLKIAKEAVPTGTFIRQRLEEGQFDDTNLTLRDLTRIKQSFVTLLTGIYHPRIPYPPSGDTRTPAEPAHAVVGTDVAASA